MSAANANELLDACRALVVRLQQATVGDDDARIAADGVALAAAFAKLDEKLSRDGLVPDRWHVLFVRRSQR